MKRRYEERKISGGQLRGDTMSEAEIQEEDRHAEDMIDEKGRGETGECENRREEKRRGTTRK